MDAKRMLVGILLITALGLGYQYFLLHEYKLHPEWLRPGDQATTAPTNGSGSPLDTQASAAEPTTGPATQQGAWQIIPPVSPAGEVVLGSETFADSKFHLALAVDAAGAAVNWVDLNQYHEQVDQPEIFRFQHPYDLDTPHNRSLATTAVTIDGTRLDVSDQDFDLTARTDRFALYELNIDEAGAPAVRVEKEYILEKAQTDSNSPQGYEIQVNYSVANLSKDPHTVAVEFSGPTVPQAETARQETEIVAGYNDDGLLKLDHQTLGSFSKSHPSKTYLPTETDEKLPLLWLGATSNYFNAIVRPNNPAQLSGAVATALNPDSDLASRLVAIRFTTADMALATGGSTSLDMRVFFGPKRRDLLNSTYYSSFPLRYDETLVLISNWFCGLCTFPWLISFLVMLLAGFHFVLRDWGLAIIALVLCVRVILHPITKRSQISMLKMQKLAPEIERLKKKFGDDKEGFTKAQMELYKSVGFTPILGCLPMFLQTPIFIALWRALQTTFELRQAPFLEFFGHHLTWIHDLSQPDNLVKFATPVVLPFVGWHVDGIHVLPLAMAVVTFVNQKYFMPKPAAMSPEQEQQQKMMMWMTLVFPFMFYSFPSGLNLYYLTSTTLGILESQRIRDHIKRAEAAESAKGTVIVDAGKTSRASMRRQAANPIKPPVKQGWLAKQLAKMQEKAEELARDAEKRKKRER